MRLRFLLTVVCAAIAATPLCAGNLYTINTGSLTATGVLSVANVWSFDVRGAVAFDVNNGGTLIGQFLMADITGGGDPGFATLPFGNRFFVDYAGAGLANTAATTFDFTTYSLGADNTLHLFETTALGAGSDPALNALIGDNPLRFSLGLSGVAPGNGIDTKLVAQWTLVEVVGAPEPGTVSLLAVGLLVGYFRVNGRKKTGNRT